MANRREYFCQESLWSMHEHASSGDNDLQSRKTDLKKNCIIFIISTNSKIYIYPLQEKFDN
jgi:hypothetical protein